jgi:hypothetical protein
LANIAKDQNVVVGRLQQHVAVLVVTQFMQMLSDAETDAPALLVKGGTSLELRCGITASRTSRDLDVVTNHDLAMVHTKLETVVRAGWQGFSGVLTPSTPIEVPGMTVKPMRFSVKLQFNNKAFATVPLEMSPREAGNTTSFDVAESNALSLLGIGATVEVPCMSIPWQVAQKLHACTDAATAERRNDRAHDLVDLMILESLASSDLMAAINEACEAVFAARGRQSWPVVVKMHDHWEPLYRKALEGLEAFELPITGNGAVNRVNAFVARIGESDL